MPENTPTRAAPVRLQLNSDAREVLIDTIVASVADGGPPRDLTVVDKLRDAAAHGTNTIELTDEDVLTVDEMWNNIYSDEAPEELQGSGGALAAIAAEAARLRQEGASRTADTGTTRSQSVDELLDDLEENHRPGGIWTRRSAGGSALIGLTLTDGEDLRITPSSTPGSYDWASSTYEVDSAGSRVLWDRREGTATYAEMLDIASDLIDRKTPSTIGSQDVGPAHQRPYAAILMARITGTYPDAPWKLYENDAYAQSLEYNEHARINVTEEADFMSVVEGYTWEVERWSAEGQRWEVVERQQKVASIAQVRARVAELYADGEANRSLSVRSRELRAQHGGRDQTLDAILDHIQAQDTRIDRLTNELTTTSADLEQTRSALLSVARKITPARGARSGTPAVALDPSATGPVASPPPAVGPDLRR